MSPHQHNKDDSTAVDLNAMKAIADQANDEMQIAMFKIMSKMSADIGDIKGKLGEGGPVLESVRLLPLEMATVKEQVATLRLLVYGAVGMVLLGTMGCAGTAMIFFLRMQHN